MSEPRRLLVSDEPFEAMPFTAETAIKAVTEGKLCADIMNHPGWQMAREQWERCAEALRRKQLAASEDDLRHIQSTLKALAMPDRVILDSVRTASPEP